MTVFTIFCGMLTIVTSSLYLHERYKYVSDRPKFAWLRKCLRIEESDIGKDIELLVKKLAQVGEWMDNSEEKGPLTDEIRHDIGDVEWRVWKETYSYFALYSKDEELKKLALRNLSQVQGKKAIQRALKHLKGMKDESIVLVPSEEVKELTDAVLKELEELLILEKD